MSPFKSAVGGCQFSRLLAAEVCASSVVMLDRLCSDTVQDCWLPTPFASFPFTSPPVRHRVPSDSERTILHRFIMSVPLSIHMEQLVSHRIDFYGVL